MRVRRGKKEKEKIRVAVASIEEQRVQKQQLFDSGKSPSDRNRLGQFATPQSLAREIVRNALGHHGGTHLAFLEPACGSGAFVSALFDLVDNPSRIQSAVGIEFDRDLARIARGLWGPMGLQVVNDSFFAWDGKELSERRASMLVANPPYVRHHHMPAAQKAVLAQRVNEGLGIPVNGLAGMYVYFMLLSHDMLAPNAISSWLIPSEFMEVKYGSALRRYLTERVELLSIHRFNADDVQFDDALTTSAVVTFRNRPPTSHPISVSSGGSLSSPKAEISTSSSALNGLKKWTKRSVTLGEPRPAAELADYFTIRRGIATGANSFFIMERERAALELGIQESNLRPILPSPRKLQALEIGARKDGWPAIEPQLALLSAAESEDILHASDPALATIFSKAGDELRSRYLLSKRTPWYKQEIRNSPLFFCTYMGRGSESSPPFRFILNRSQAIATNTYLMLYPRAKLIEELAAGLDPMDVHSALSAIAPEFLVNTGRQYGGGLHKIEPKELGSLPADCLAELVDSTSDGLPEQLTIPA